MAVARRVRSAWTLFNVAMTLVLLPMVLLSWKEPCSTGRILHQQPNFAHLQQPREEGRAAKQQQQEQQEVEEVVAMRSRKAKDELACPLAGSGTFSPVRLRSTALASYQGSGNTWARHLLTTATGILTGTAYPNETREVPAGNGISRAYRLLVIKTHMNPKESRTHFPVDRAVLIVRNPYEAILSEFNRGGVNPDDEHADKRHVAVRQPLDFKLRWPKFVETQMVMWLKFNWYWAKDSAPLHVLVYHRLVEDTGPELGKVLRFLNESSLRPAIHCATRAPEGWAHRKKPAWQKEAAVFNGTQTTFLNLAIDRIQKVLHAKTGQDFQDFQRWKR